MRRVTNTNFLLVNLPKPQGKVSLGHLLNAIVLLMSWQSRSTSNEIVTIVAQNSAQQLVGENG